MVTTQEDDIPPETQTVADWFGNVWEEVREVGAKASTTLHGRTGRPLWPVVLLVVLGLALVIDVAWASAVGIVALLLLAVWLAGQVR